MTIAIKKIMPVLVVSLMSFIFAVVPAYAGANVSGTTNSAQLTAAVVGDIPSTPNLKPQREGVSPFLKGAEQYLTQKMLTPQYDGMLEWAMLGFYADGKNVEAFSQNRIAQIARGGMLSADKNTDYQRTILGALAAGQNPDSYGGINLLEKVWSSQNPQGKFADSISGQGDRLVNAHVWGIISLYAAGREIADADKALQWLNDHQNDDGGFSIDINIEESDVDMTAMSIIALACLGKDANYPAVQKALNYLKEQQNSDGTFGAWGTSTTESCAQVIQALVALGLDPTGAAWSKEGKNALTGLLSYRLPDGSFSHGPEMLSNDMATAQALIALVDLANGESVYQKLHGALKTTFNDLPANHFATQAVNNLVAQKVIQGYPDGSFRPDKKVTREEFVVMLIKGLKLAPSNDSTSNFIDLPCDHWADGYIKTAISKNYVQGYPGNLFGTGKNIVGAEAAAILVKAAGLSEQAKNSQATDTWYSGIINTASAQGFLYPGFSPVENTTRAQCAYSINQLIIVKNKI